MGISGLVERAAELGRIDAALASACTGGGTAIVIEGEPGIGKTALLREALANARDRGMVVVTAAGTEFEAELPFGVIRQCLEPILRDEPDRDELFAGAAGLAAPLLLASPGDGDAGSFGVLHGLFWLISNLAQRQPLLIAVDDAHWADDASRRFLAYLVRRVDSVAAALLIATRPDDPESDGSPGLLSDPAAELLTPTALSEAGVGELLAHATDGPVDPVFTRACLHASGGNPFLLAELARTLREQDVPFTATAADQVAEITPPLVERSTRARLARLDRHAGQLARAIAVLGGDVPEDLAYALAGLDPTDGRTAASALITAGLLDSAHPLRFRHPLLRAAVVASVTPFERDASHRRAAKLLRERGSTIDHIAGHLLMTSPGLDDTDRRTLRAAAARAWGTGAAAAAARILRRVLEEPLEPALQAELLLELGRYEYAAGEPTSAVAHVDQAMQQARDPITRARAVLLYAQATVRGFAEADRINRLVLSSIDAVRDLDRELALRLQAFGLYIDDDPELVRQRIAEATALPGDTPGEAAVLGHAIYRRMVPGARAAEIAGLAERGAREVYGLVEEGGPSAAFAGVVLGLRWTDRLDQAERILDRALAIARRRGSIPEYATALSRRSEVYVRQGRLLEAEADARAAMTTGVDEAWQFARGISGLVSSLVAQGRADEAACAADAELGDRELLDIPPMTTLLLSRAQGRAACGDHAAAIADFDEAVRRRRRFGAPSASWVGDLLLAASSHHALGNTDAAGALLAQARELAQAWDTPGALGEVRHAQALHGGDGDRLELLREAESLLGRSPARFLHARALVDLGATLRRAGHRSDAREPLRAGYDLARECGARGLAETARQELAASGVRVRRERLRGVESLTPSELRIAQMAADGSSNIKIAQALFVTVKTVEAHLTHAYQKLDIARRGELARALADGARLPPR